MLAVPADRLPAAIGDLDPGNRALLDLSLRRGVSDAEIGELLRKEPTDVARGRDAVLELLADALDVGGHDRRDRVRLAVAALPDDAWRAGAAPPPPAPPPPRAPAEPPEPPEERPPPRAERDRDEERAVAARDLDEDFHLEPEERRSRRGGLLAAIGLLAVLVALAAVLLSGGDDDDEPERTGDNGSEPAPQGGPGDEPSGRNARLTTLGGGPGSGRVTVTDEGATITLRGLPKPDGAYGVWLYDNIVRAMPLGTVPDGSGKLTVSLPPDASNYRFLDVSNEPADGNRNHSGDSVLRAPLRKLLRD
jgi:hypothetical protein